MKIYSLIWINNQFVRFFVVNHFYRVFVIPQGILKKFVNPPGICQFKKIYPGILPKNRACHPGIVTFVEFYEGNCSIFGCFRFFVLFLEQKNRKFFISPGNEKCKNKTL